MNMLGSFLLLAGIALVYGHTGALNLAQIGRTLADGQDLALVSMSAVLVMSGLLIKAAIMPFHFWLADAHAVAPAPVCVIFSGVMVPVALFGVMRLYWTVYAGVPAIDDFVHSALLYVGAFTAVLGGLMSLAQRHIKRLLAFSTVSHMGVLLCGLASASPGGAAGFLLYLAGHGLAKGGLFMGAGILLAALQSVDELALRGRARHLPFTGASFALGGLLLAGLPSGLMAGGRELLDKAGEEAHAWLPYALGFGSALTGAAVLRLTGRVFLGLGPEPGEEKQGASQQEDEKPRPARLLVVPFIVLLLLCLLPQGHALETLASHAAGLLMDHAGYAALVLDGRFQPPTPPEPEPSGPLLGWCGTALAILIAALELNRHRLPRWYRRSADLSVDSLFGLLERIHSGHVGGYVVWMLAGLATFAWSFLA
jgi:multicomponent Na+:H+ antiporter subunit D